MVFLFRRWDAVPVDHVALMRITCFGEMGGPYYSDEIVAHAKTKEELLEYCKERGFELASPNGWNEYFIKEHPDKIKDADYLCGIK